MSSRDADPTATVLRGRVVSPAGVLDDGVVVLGDGTIRWVGPVEDAPAGVHVPREIDGTLLPGLVDLHCHGGGGVGFDDAPDVATARRAVHEHRRHGTTTMLASVVTAEAATLLERCALLADLCESGDLAGIHLEGPFLSRARCGAQDPSAMVRGDAGLVRELVAAARGHLTMMTVAPEIAGVLGADGVVAALGAAGVVPAIGHTDASAEVVGEAVALMTRAMRSTSSPSLRPVASHLFNAMRPIHHRDPGPVAACLAAAARGEAVVELVADGVHLAPATVRAVFDLVGPGAVALVTDAVAAAGMADGRYTLGSVAIRVVGGVARRAEGDTIAGGTAHLLDVVRTTVAAGVPLADAVRAASTTPATVLGRSDIGALEAGRRADVVVVDDDLRVTQVLRAGEPAARRSDRVA